MIYFTVMYHRRQNINLSTLYVLYTHMLDPPLISKKQYLSQQSLYGLVNIFSHCVLLITAAFDMLLFTFCLYF